MSINANYVITMAGRMNDCNSYCLRIPLSVVQNHHLGKVAAAPRFLMYVGLETELKAMDRRMAGECNRGYTWHIRQMWPKH